MTSAKRTTSIWTDCSFGCHWIEALCLHCFKKELPVWKEKGNELYIVANYTYNQQTYSFPVRIDKTKTSSFLKAFEVEQIDSTSVTPVEWVEKTNITDLVRKWLGPNQDFHDKYVTPWLLGFRHIKVCFIDTDTFDTIERVFSEDQMISLTEEVPIKPPPQQLQVETLAQPEEHIEPHLYVDSPLVDDDPREPRKSFLFNEKELIDQHIR